MKSKEFRVYSIDWPGPMGIMVMRVALEFLAAFLRDQILHNKFGFTGSDDCLQHAWKRSDDCFDGLPLYMMPTWIQQPFSRTCNTN